MIAWAEAPAICGPCQEEQHQDCDGGTWVRDVVDQGAAILVPEICTCFEVGHDVAELWSR